MKRGKVISSKDIDNGQAFDWGKTSGDYAVYRDLYPEEFYQKIVNLDFASGDKAYLISGREQAFCREISIDSAHHLSGRIFPRIK